MRNLCDIQIIVALAINLLQLCASIEQSTMPEHQNNSEQSKLSFPSSERTIETLPTNLTATISTIQHNITRVLNMYFENVTDEYGYGYGKGLSVSPQQNIQPNTTFSNIVPTKTSNATWTTAKNISDYNENPQLTTSSGIINFNNDSTKLTTLIVGTSPSITYPRYKMEMRVFDNCSKLFANYSQPQTGVFCNWTWDGFLCWPPTPGGVLAHLHCPAGWHGVDTQKFAKRKCESTGFWGKRPNDTTMDTSHGWTDYQPCFKPEVYELMQQVPNLDLLMDIARRTRILEIVGLVLSLVALIISLIIFCNFRSLRNNRTKIHKNLFIAMVLQVVIRLTLYLDQAIHRDKPIESQARTGGLPSGIDNTPYLCEGSYVLLEYARTAMFMWMFLEGWYLHNVVTVTVFQGAFPFGIILLIGWGLPIIMTTIWAICTALFHGSSTDCWWNYNLTPYYWILEGPRLVIIMLNLLFLVNIIRVLVDKLRQSQASDTEQTRKAVRAALVLLPLLGITNALQLQMPDLHTPWKFALWSYGTHFLVTFQGFFIALIYCFLNGEVRSALLKSLGNYLSNHGKSDWMPKCVSSLPQMSSITNDIQNNRILPSRRSHTAVNTSEEFQIQHTIGSITSNSEDDAVTITTSRNSLGMTASKQHVSSEQRNSVVCSNSVARRRNRYSRNFESNKILSKICCCSKHQIKSRMLSIAPTTTLNDMDIISDNIDNNLSEIVNDSQITSIT